MMHTLNIFKNIVPENIKGKSLDKEHAISTDTENEAKIIFKKAADKMLHLNKWAELGGIISAEFLLTDHEGQPLERAAAAGDFVRIDVQGPGSIVGGGYDWVNIEALEDKSNHESSEESIGMRLRACKPPGQNTDKVAHFFKGDATSSFVIYRNKNRVHSFYFGRNEVINTDTDRLLDNVRNIIIGGVALGGVSEIQWDNLIKAFLRDEN